MRPRTLLASPFALALVLAGCGKKDGSEGEKKPAPAPVSAPTGGPAAPDPGPKPTGTPRPQSGLTVTLDGKPVAMATALAWTSWDGAIELTASSVPVGCDEVTGQMRSLHDGEVTFSLEIGSTLQPDGTRATELRQAYFAGMNRQLSGVVTSSGDGAAGQSTTVAVDLEISSASEPRQTLVVKGTIDALGCPPPPAAEGVPPLPEPMAATVEVAGTKLPVRGARYTTLGDYRSLVLRTGGEGCESIAFQPPSELVVELTWFDPGKDEIGQISISGGLIGAQKSDQTFDRAQVKVSPKLAGPGDYDLHLAATVMGYPVTVEGKVTATACP